MLFFSSNLYDSFQLAKTAALALGLVFFLIIYLISGSKPMFSFSLAAAFLLFLWFSFSLISSRNNPPLFQGLLFLAPAAFFVFYLKPPHIRSLLLALNLTALTAMAYGLWQFSFGGQSRPYSFFGNPIFFAEFCAGLLPFMLAGLIIPGRHRIFSLVNVVLFPAVLIVCSSRGAAISSAVSLAVFIYYYARSGYKNGPGLKTAGIILASFLAVAILLPGFSSSLQSAVSRAKFLISSSNPEIKNRILMVKTAAEIFKTSPAAGAGAGAVRLLHPAMQAKEIKNNPGFDYVSTSYSHNDYAQLLAETGAVGLLLYLAFIFSVMAGAEKAAPYMDKDSLIISSAGACSILFFMCESFFNFPLFSMPSALLLFAVCGITASITLKFTEKIIILPRAVTAAAVIVILTITGFCAFRGAGPLVSNFSLKYAQALDAQDSPYADVYYKKAIKLDPSGFYAYAAFADYLARYKALNEAFDMYALASKIMPYSSDMIYNMGNMLFMLNRPEDAVAYYEKAIFYFPAFAQAHYMMYRSLMALKKENEAVKFLQAAIKADPSVVKNSFKGQIMYFGEVTK